MCSMPTCGATGGGGRMSAEPRILFLRGVNVGTSRKLPMADLRALLAGLGLTGVTTHIQSGNAVFRDPQRRADLAGRVLDAIGAAFPFRPEALVLDLPALEGVLAANPYATIEDPSRVQIGFLAAGGAADTERLAALAAPGEGWHLTEAALYLHLPWGSGRSKLAAGAEKAVRTPMTMRNRRVAEAVAALAREMTC
ncbi:hypothetical protein DDE23_00315 [Pararhodobacter aggregans]|uniref:DUF1697 domain-containing protein n=2 Tax=Pararhodobacter aggregans TaxID=404875 RepID=A0A2T7UVS5_9RHOB|nr:hypothetical protein DDE23_00315 [Pararhodobacter aggregans]